MGALAAEAHVRETSHIQALSEIEKTAISANLFPEARYVVASLKPSSWHRDSSGSITASLPQSSQALALAVFCTIDTLSSRDSIAARWADALSLPSFGSTRFIPEVVLDASLLNERKSTQVDAVIEGSDASALVECKFTEPDGGSCSQPVPRKNRSSGILSPQCNGAYVHQQNPVSGKSGRCALSVKGIRYWEFVPDVLRISADADHTPCPFVGGWYQWMRNLVAARALAHSRQHPHNFIIAYADGPFPMARKIGANDWNQFNELLTESVKLRAVSFQRLISLALEASGPSDVLILQQLEAWLSERIRRVAP